ncbi:MULTISPECIES: hypothetical protein [Nocardia]|uniref:hypothetical protein n=1 Tax=Nocardia TaxID=1817 RepID=UPI000D699F87|nr:MULTISPECIES: hypothetical protein [Nocardia]
MSFLLRRSVPRAWAGWRDDFNTYPVGNIQRPWVHLADGTVAQFNSSGELRLPANFFSGNGGGESYEFQPFTPNWGMEYEIWWPVTGVASQGFTMYFTDSWARIGGAFANMVGVRMLHDVTRDYLQLSEFTDGWSVAQPNGAWDSPVVYNGNDLHVKIWVENDTWVRIWVNDIYVGSSMITPAFKLGPDRRCLRTLNTSLADVYMRWIDHYDRPPSVPNMSVWSSILFDDFNRADGAVGSPWTQLGTNAGIVSNSWSTTGTTDGSRGLLWNTTLTGGKVRVEATVGGNLAPHATAASSLIVCSNSAGTQGLCANIYSGSVYISRFSTAISGTPTMTDFQALTSGVSIASGDKLAFCVYNGFTFLEKNGTPIIYAGNAHGTVPASNTYAGLRVGRTSGNNSNSWNDVRIYSGI